MIDDSAVVRFLLFRHEFLLASIFACTLDVEGTGGVSDVCLCFKNAAIFTTRRNWHWPPGLPSFGDFHVSFLLEFCLKFDSECQLWPRCPYWLSCSYLQLLGVTLYEKRPLDLSG